ncbi:hypothetical protein N0V88_007881 [Collariella sp. IMI 366227]|nr:hypothetical protein N0V88_007881 [Collariella sp. IMI 366227]
MVQLLFQPSVYIPALAVVLVALLAYCLLTAGSDLPKLPIAGAKTGDWFPFFQALWRNTFDIKSGIKFADEHYRNQAVLLPTFHFPNQVLLPRSETQFVTDQPDSVLDIHSHTIEVLQSDYTLADPSLIRNPLHHKLIATTLTSQIGNLVPEVAEETAWGFEHEVGSPAEYKEVCVYEAMRKILAYATNRVAVGAPMCRDPDLLRESTAHAQEVPLMAQILRLFWKPLRPAIASVLTLPIQLRMWRFEKIVLPLIERRLADYEARTRDPEDKTLGPEPNDFLQWCIKQAREIGDPHLSTPRMLAGRLLFLDFAAILTSSVTLSGAVFDLAAGKPKDIDELREEIEGVLAEEGGKWNKQALSKMHKLDSMMRESARLNSFVTIGLARTVVAENGLVTPSGVRIPRGTCVIVPSYVVLQDSDVYPEAQEFKPFRFVNHGEQSTGEGVGDAKRAGKAFASTSTDYLAFGHGRNACPGRFFAANELKLMVAHLVLNYDMEMGRSRPQNTWIMGFRLPPLDATVRMKKRFKV